MSVQTEIDRISTAVQNAHLKVIEKGGTSAAPYLVANLAQAIGTIPEATEPTLQSKSVTPSESAQTVKPDSGYDGLSQVSVGAISKIYVGSSVPKQDAQTITPGTADKTIASGRYLTGTQTIKGDANLVAGNIKQGVSIFGVAGSYEGSGGSGGSEEIYTVTLHVNGVMCDGLVHYNGETWSLLSWWNIDEKTETLSVKGGTVIVSMIYEMTGAGYIDVNATGGVTVEHNDGYLQVFSVNGNGNISVIGNNGM